MLKFEIKHCAALLYKMPSVYKLVENDDESSAEYYASIEGLSAAIYHVFTGYLIDEEIPYESQSISKVVCPKALLEALNKNTTIYNKFAQNVKIIGQDNYTLFVSEYLLNP